MQTLARTLAMYDLELLRVIAARWDTEPGTHDPKAAAERLAAAMLSPERVEAVWNKLTDEQRGALQAVLGSPGSKMPGLMFGRMFGEIRQMGPGKLEREKPYLNPVSVAEALYYRGLIAAAFGESGKGSQVFIYVPSDLAVLMPTHQTGYKVEASPEAVESVPPPDNVRQADTLLVDDLTTLLAYAALVDMPLVDGQPSADNLKEIKSFLIGSSSPARIGLMLALAKELGLMQIGKDGLVKPSGNTLRQWLEQPRPVQVRQLSEAWRTSASYNELAFTPGLKVEQLSNDPLLARQTVLTFLEMVPPNGWWQVDHFIEAVKEEEPEFQRPNGDYDRWYIRDAQTGQYLRGFATWDKIDGAMLRFILIGPMHGLGLLDIAQNGAFCRLTAYGRALIGENEWVAAGPETASIKVLADGTCEVPRMVSRFDRYQLSRFTQWIKAGDPYQYKVGVDGFAQATAQHIKADQILTFLRRATNDSVPAPVVKMIETWEQGSESAQTATLSQMIVLRVPTPDLLVTLQAMPQVRRYLGAQLGPQAVAVRPDQWEALVTALQAAGISVSVDV